MARIRAMIGTVLRRIRAGRGTGSGGGGGSAGTVQVLAFGPSPSYVVLN
jgi:hypothetical protein